MKTGNPTDKKENIKLLVFNFLLVILFFWIDLKTELGVADGVLYVTVILLSRNLSRSGYIPFFAIACSMLTVFGFFLSPPGGELWKVIANRLLAIYAIWVTAILLLQRKRIEGEREKVIVELQEAFARIKALSGLLPICASCKKIRDDKGYWNQIEVYIRDHSEAEFTHGICPDCADKIREEIENLKNQRQGEKSS